MLLIRTSHPTLLFLSTMMGFVSSFAGATLRTPSALAGRAVAVAPASAARVARWSMVQSKAMPFMEAPPALDGTLAGGMFCGLVLVAVG